MADKNLFFEVHTGICSGQELPAVHCVRMGLPTQCHT